MLTLPLSDAIVDDVYMTTLPNLNFLAPVSLIRSCPCESHSNDDIAFSLINLMMIIPVPHLFLKISIPIPDNLISTDDKFAGVVQEFRDQARKLVDMLDITVPVVAKLKVSQFPSRANSELFHRFLWKFPPPPYTKPGA